MNRRTTSPAGRARRAPRNPKATEAPPQPRRKRARRARKTEATVAAAEAAEPEWADWREGAYFEFAVVEAEIRRRLGDPGASWRDAICRCPRSHGVLRGCKAAAQGSGRWRDCPHYHAALAAGERPPRTARPPAAQKRKAILQARTMCGAGFREALAEGRTALATADWARRR